MEPFAQRPFVGRSAAARSDGGAGLPEQAAIRRTNRTTSQRPILKQGEQGALATPERHRRLPRADAAKHQRIEPARLQAFCLRRAGGGIAGPLL